MPAKSEKQAKFMRAVAHGWKPQGKDVPSKKVARKFMAVEVNSVDPKEWTRGTLTKVPTTATLYFTGKKTKSDTKTKTIKEDTKYNDMSVEQPKYVDPFINEVGIAKEPREDQAEEISRLKKGMTSKKVRAKRKDLESAEIAKKRAENMKLRADKQKQESVSQAERSKLFKQDQSLAKKERNVRRRRGKVVYEAQTPDTADDARIKNKKKQVIPVTNPVSKQDVYQKELGGKTPEEQKKGVPASEKNRGWFEKMLSTALGRKKFKNPNVVQAKR